VVRGIVQDLGGTIDLVSEPGRGTRFQIVLPCAEFVSSAKALEPAADPDRGPISGIGRSSRQSHAAVVLVVEDENALRKPLSKMLSRHGFSVIEAGDGLAALDVIRKQSCAIDFLCLDTTLPGASAREVLEEAQRLRLEMKVIVTSAYTEEMAGVLLQSGIEHFLRKPYGFHDLVQLIDALADVRRTRAANIPQ
jgi:two-component system, cell cycle sensor histidine kinase and response regulator CckA